MAKKFIISINGELRYGTVIYHKDLLKEGENQCWGGGFYEINHELKRVNLSGESGDFGLPKFEKLMTLPDYFPTEYDLYYNNVKINIPEVVHWFMPKEYCHDGLKIKSSKQKIGITKKSNITPDTQKFNISGYTVYAKNQKEALKKIKKLRKNEVKEEK